MKTYSLLIALSLIACKNPIKNEIDADTDYLSMNNSIKEKVIGNTEKIVNSKEDLIGYWRGAFKKTEKKDNEIDYVSEDEIFVSSKYRARQSRELLLAIRSIQNNVLDGYVYTYGTIRNVKGVLKQEKDSYVMELTEKKVFYGSFKYKFTIKLGTNSLWGTLGNINEKGNSKFDFTSTLQKSNFKYNPDSTLEYLFVDWEKSGKVKEYYEYTDSLGKAIKEDYEREGSYATTDTILKLNPSKELFRKELVENLSKGDLYILRNLIYAKHGFRFKNLSLEKYFLGHEWYLPVSENVDKELTAIEKKNSDLLKRYERNAKEYYQVFGR